jgi:four helix bundle protein
MSTIRSFEDLVAWQKARGLAVEVCSVSKGHSFARDFALRDQIRRAAVSVMSNIAEGFERDGTRELLHFLSTARASCGEVRSQLYIALDQEYLAAGDFHRLSDLAREASRLIEGFARYLRSSALSGRKYAKPSPT